MFCKIYQGKPWPGPVNVGVLSSSNHSSTPPPGLLNLDTREDSFGVFTIRQRPNPRSDRDGSGVIYERIQPIHDGDDRQ